MDVSNVPSMLRSVLLSSKHPIPIKKLLQEFQLLIGWPIPFKELGFKSLQEYLQSIPDVVKLSRNNNGEIFCEAVSTSPTVHISNLVRQQKNDKKPPFRGPVPRHPSKRRPTPPHLPLSRRSPPLPAVKPMKTTAAVAHQKPMPPPALLPTPVSKTNNTLLPTPVSKTNYEVPPRFAKHASRSVHVTITQSTGRKSQMTPTNGKQQTPPLKAIKPNMMHKTALEEFANQNNLGKPLYKTQYTERQGKRLFFSTVNVSLQKFTSYPTEKSSKEAAEQEAAKCALEDLKANLKGKDVVLKVSSDDCIPRRILDLVSGKFNGVWADHIATKYEEKFNEKLPPNWEDRIADNGNFSVERISGTKSIIYPKPSTDEYRSVTSVSDNSEESAASEASTCSTPSQTLLANALTFPSDKFWNVYITNVHSTADIWIRLIGEEYSEKYENLATDMELHYMGDVKSQCCMSSIVVGDLFVVKVDDCWHRVEIEDIYPNETVKCFFVDHGDVGTHKISDLYSLEPEFRSLPFQAVQCRLFDLEDVSGMLMITNHLLQLAVGKTLVAEIVSKDEEMPISVILYDTSTEDDVNINEVLTEMALREIQSPRLRPGVTEVYLTHVTPMGDVFFQLSLSVLGVLEKYVERAASENKVASVVEANKLYLARFSEDNVFYRAVITDVNAQSKGRVPVFFVDYGNADNVKLNEVLEISKPYELLSKIPYQAIKCKMHDVPLASDLEWNSDVSNRLLLLAHKELSLLAKLIPSSTSEVPCVEVFKRLPDTNELVSVNQTLAVDCALFTKKVTRCSVKVENVKVEAGEANSLVQECTDIPSLLLPSVGEYCDIHITLAASPYNFMFQPWLGGEAFDQMMVDMHNYYGVQGKGRRLNSDEVQSGFYAVTHYGVWYRVHATASDVLKQDEMVSVYFIDYGDHALVNISNLRILKEDFRSLPAQALKGKLGGVVPAFGDWLPEDCLRFTDLTVNKQFVAIVMGYEDANEACEAPKIVMKLVDTSSDKDVYIHDILLEEKRAELLKL